VEFIIMEQTKELLSVPLTSLLPSLRNVRRHSVGQVEELAALIDSQGLLHPLIVTEQVVGRGAARRVKFAVAAGERRRRALVLLDQRGRLPKGHEVLCELVTPERALEVSLAENSGREPMDPADEFEAFKVLIDEGKGIEDVSARFGVSPLVVQRRLKLAALSPKLLVLYREKGINLDQLMALALTDDHGTQERTWFEAQAWDRDPATLRRKITADEVEAAGNALVRFVGIEAYEAAGGVVRRDLFDDEQSRFLADPALLERLALEKLEAVAASVREEEWSWVEVRVEAGSHTLRQFTPAEHVLREPTPQERDALAALSIRSEELDQQSGALDAGPGWSTDEVEVIDLEQQDIAARTTSIHDGLRTWSADVKARAGAMVTVSREGDCQVIRGLVREADRKAMVAAQKVAGRSTRGHSDGEPNTAAAPTVSARPTSGCSESLAKRLAAHRTVAMQVMLARNTPVALVALTHVFVQRVFGDELRRAFTALQVTPQTSAYSLQSVADDLKESPAWQALEVAKLIWKESLPEQPSEWFAWLTAMRTPDLLDLLALCVALTFNALPSAGVASEARVLADAVGLDMADWWTPTANGYLNHVSKPQIMEALKEASPDATDDSLAGMKKEMLVVKAASQLAGKRWLPLPLRRPPS
jgi:ParB family chromosome partitioning protein